MKAYQVHSGELNKHGFQHYDLQATYLSKEKALEHAQNIVNETPLDGNILIDNNWYGSNKQFKSWILEGWEYVTICLIEEIEITE
jgi:hypothetical protein